MGLKNVINKDIKAVSALLESKRAEAISDFERLGFPDKKNEEWRFTNIAPILNIDFKVKKDDLGEEFGKSVEEMLLEKIKKFNYPVCFDFPVGHQKNNMALKCGLVHQLQVDEKIVSLKEI